VEIQTEMKRYLRAEGLVIECPADMNRAELAATLSRLSYVLIREVGHEVEEKWQAMAAAGDPEVVAQVEAARARRDRFDEEEGQVVTHTDSVPELSPAAKTLQARWIGQDGADSPIVNLEADRRSIAPKAVVSVDESTRIQVLECGHRHRVPSGHVWEAKARRCDRCHVEAHPELQPAS